MADETTTTTTTAPPETPATTPTAAPKASKPKPIYRWTGDGTMRIPGAPARDLFAADVARLKPAVLREVEASSLYEKVGG